MSPPAAAAPAAAAVLLVDDRPENLLALEALLAPLARELGARLLRAGGADDALRHVLAEGDALAVVLLDVQMPGTDGLETARLIRQRARTGHVPVIFVTAHDADARAVADGYAAGAVDYLFKPLAPDVVRAKVRTFVELYRYREAARAAAAAGAAAEAARAAAEAAGREEAALVDTVRRVGAALASELDLERVVQVVTDEATALTGAEFGAFFYTVTNPRGGGELLLHTLAGVPPEHFAHFAHPRATPVFGPTFRGEGVVRSADITADPRYGQMAPHHGMPAGHLPVKSYLAVPVRSRTGDVLGGLFFGHAEPDVFGEREERLVVGVAGWAAVAMDNARLYAAEHRARSDSEAAAAQLADQALELELANQQLQDQAAELGLHAEALRETAAELEERTEAAEAANRAKGQFLATMSHELRTPLNAIGGYAELLEMGIRGPVTDQQRQDLGRIQQSQRHLLGLVNEVLDLAKVDAGELRVERAAVRAGDTVDAALALVRPQAAAKGLTLADACGGAADRPYLGDEPRVRQVLVNLLANAVKFTAPGGRVAVTCGLTDAPPAGGTLAPGVPYVALRVEDTGVGIPPDQQERIFEPFTQAEGGANPYTRPAGGTGLGLAISRRLARLMGGDLTLESREGQGSAFTLWLPTPERRAAPRPTPPAGEWPVAGRRTPPAGAPAALAAVPALARIGGALADEPGPVVRAWVARLRADPGIPESAPGGAAYTDAELEDHAATFIADIGLAVRALGGGGGEPAALLRDGTAILALLTERHGAQRARLGWPDAAVAREFALLREVLDATVLGLVGPEDAAAVEFARAVVTQLLGRAERVARGGFRLASTTAGHGPPSGA